MQRMPHTHTSIIQSRHCSKYVVSVVATVLCWKVLMSIVGVVNLNIDKTVFTCKPIQSIHKYYVDVCAMV